MNERFYTTHAPPVKMQGALETIALLPVHAQGGLRLILKPGADAGFYLLPVHAQGGLREAGSEGCYGPARPI